MLRKTINYSLLALTLWGLSACSGPRTIMIEQPRTRPIVHRPVAISHRHQPVIREEILLGRGSSNSDLGERVDVPKNTPSVEVNATVNDNNDSSDENREVSRASSSEVIQRMPFPVQEYRYVKKRGSSTVSGTAYLENSDTFEKIRGKKIKLWLNPVTSYSRQWYEESYLRGHKLSKTDKRLYNYLKFTYSNSSGEFSFFGVPAGEYYLTGSISCEDECGFSSMKSIRLVREISVGHGVTHVDLTKQVP